MLMPFHMFQVKAVMPVLRLARPGGAGWSWRCAEAKFPHLNTMVVNDVSGSAIGLSYTLTHTLRPWPAVIITNVLSYFLTFLNAHHPAQGLKLFSIFFMDTRRTVSTVVVAAGPQRLGLRIAGCEKRERQGQVLGKLRFCPWTPDPYYRGGFLLRPSCGAL